MTKYKTLILFLFFVLFGCPIYAYNLRQISNKDGLANNLVLSLYQDKKGFLWFGTSDGLSVYDGVQAQTYRPLLGSESLSGNLVQSVLEAQDGVLWIQTDKGLDRIDNKRLVVSHFDGSVSGFRICKDRDDAVYVLQGDGVLLAYKDSVSGFRSVASDLDCSNIKHMMIMSDNSLLLLFTNGQLKNFKIELSSEGGISLSKPHVKSLATGIISAYSEGDVIYFVDASYTLYEYDLVENRKYYISNLQSQITQRGEISSIIKQNNNYYVAFRNNGLIRLNNYSDRQIKYEIESVDVRAGVTALLKDRLQDVVWIATEGQGVYIYSNDTYSMRSALFSNFAKQITHSAKAFLVDRENSLWIGTDGDGLVKIYNYGFNDNFTASRREYFTTINSQLNNNAVSAFAVSNHNVFWIGSRDGLNYYTYDYGQVRRISMGGTNETLRNINSIVEVNDSTLLLATGGDGIVKASVRWINGLPWISNLQRSVLEGGMAANQFTTIYQDGEEWWVGSEGLGSFRLDINSLTLSPVELGNELRFDNVFSLAGDKNNNLWLATNLGLVKHWMGKDVVYNKNIGFPSNIVYGVLPDSNGNLWLSISSGIIKFNPGSESYLAYDHTMGLEILEFTKGASYHDLRSGVFFFGGKNGFVTVQENMTETKAYHPDIIFNGLSVLGKKRDIDHYMVNGSLEIDYKQNFFDVSFIALDYVDGNNYTYFYKLGDDAGWIDNGQDGVVSFTDMPTGRYTLLVKYVNRVTGVESSPYKLVVKVVAPWYASVLAYVLYIILLIAVAFLVVKILKNRNKKEREREFRLIQEKHKEELYDGKLNFLANVAHNFINPMTLIYGSCSNIKKDEGVDSHIVKCADLISHNTERIDLLIEDIVEYHRIEKGGRSPHIGSISVSGIMQSIVESFYAISDQRRIQFEANVPESLEWNSDKDFFVTSVTNFLSNAFNNTEPEGIIRLDVIEKQNIVELSIAYRGESWGDNSGAVFDKYNLLSYIEVHDEKACLNRLKLVIGERLIRLLNGNVRIDQSNDGYNRLIIELPLIKLDEPLRNDAEKEDYAEIEDIKLSELVRRNIYTSQDLPQSVINELKPTMIVLDKDFELLGLISTTFSADFNVVATDRLDIADKFILENRVDIILIDSALDSKMSSYVKKLKDGQQTNQISVILTFSRYDADQQDISDLGADMCIGKPFNIDDLRLSINQILSEKGILKTYFNSPLNAFDLSAGKLIQNDDKRFVQTILDIINDHISDRNLSVSFIAAKLGMSTRHLYRKLNEMEAESPLHMIRDCRLHIAQNLLLNSPLTVDEIIYKSGFYNRGTFFKVFAEKYNCTPREYREKYVE